MSAAPRQSSSRLDFRIRQEHKSLIERAASADGKTVSSYATATLVKAAQETIQRASLTVLSARGSKIFLEMLDDDGRPNAALKAAARRYKGRRG